MKISTKIQARLVPTSLMRLTAGAMLAVLTAGCVTGGGGDCPKTAVLQASTNIGDEPRRSTQARESLLGEMRDRRIERQSGRAR